MGRHNTRGITGWGGLPLAPETPPQTQVPPLAALWLHIISGGLAAFSSLLVLGLLGFVPGLHSPLLHDQEAMAQLEARVNTLEDTVAKRGPMAVRALEDIRLLQMDYREIIQRLTRIEAKVDVVRGRAERQSP